MPPTITQDTQHDQRTVLVLEDDETGADFTEDETRQRQPAEQHHGAFVALDGGHAPDAADILECGGVHCCTS